MEFRLVLFRSNVSVNITEPDADPLGEWLASIDKLLGAIPSDVIVCPAHGEPFKGLHVRLTALRDEHRMRLYKLAEAMAEAPMRAVDTFPLLFNRPIGADHQRSEEHTSELQSLMRISYAVFCLKKKT